MAVAIDSNILIDVLGRPSEHTPYSVEALNAALTRGALIICPVVAAETSLYFASAADALPTGTCTSSAPPAFASRIASPCSMQSTAQLDGGLIWAGA